MPVRKDNQRRQNGKTYPKEYRLQGRTYLAEDILRVTVPRTQTENQKDTED